MRLYVCDKKKTTKAWCQVNAFSQPCFTSLGLDAVTDDKHPDVWTHRISLSLMQDFCLWTSLCITVCCKPHVSSQAGTFQTLLWATYHRCFQTKWRWRPETTGLCPMESQEELFKGKRPWSHSWLHTQRATVLTLTLYWELLTRERLQILISHSYPAPLSTWTWRNEAQLS